MVVITNEKIKLFKTASLDIFPVFCPMCGGSNESVYHLIHECKEMRDLRTEVLGREDSDFEWLVRVV